MPQHTLILCRNTAYNISTNSNLSLCWGCNGMPFGHWHSSNAGERIATGVNALAMTEEVRKTLQPSHFRCHCEPVRRLVHPRVVSLALRAIHLLAIRSPQCAALHWPLGQSFFTTKQNDKLEYEILFRCGGGFCWGCGRLGF